MKVAVGCDPNAEVLHQELIDYVRTLGHEADDFSGPDIDYARVAEEVAEAVAARKYDRGILLCGTGIEVMAAANRVRGAYIANVTNVYSARRVWLSKNCNIVAVSSRDADTEKVKEIVRICLEGVSNSDKDTDAGTEYDGYGFF